MDLNVMLREQARSGLQSKLDAAVTAGDTEAARKVTKEISDFEIAIAPAKTVSAYSDVEIKAELNKLPWFGTDPKKTAKALEFGKMIDPKKFATAVEFSKAVIDAVEAEFKPAGSTEPAETDEEREAREAEEAAGKAAAKPRKSDAPGDNALSGNRRAAASGPWKKLTDAPAEVQKEIRRTADRFVPQGSKPEAREKFIASALESHYRQHEQKKGK